MNSERVRIGIQGELGSTNERAAKSFATQEGWSDFEIIPLRSTERVLAALDNGIIDFGTFAWESSRAGLVAETQEAIRKHSYHKISEIVLEIDHAILAVNPIDLKKMVNVFSHSQALKEHQVTLTKLFPKFNVFEEVDTAYAAERLKKGEYPVNSIVIAPFGCAERYNLSVYLKDLPSNEGYWTKIFLVKCENAL